MAKDIYLSRENAMSLLFCCQIGTLGLLRQMPSYSLWETAIAGYPVGVLWLARICSVLTFVVLLALLERGRPHLFGRPVVAAFGAALCAGVALALYGAAILPVYAVSQVLVGVAHAWILAGWAARFAVMDAACRNRVIGFSALLAVGIFTAIGAIPLAWRAPVFLAMTVGSVVPLIAARNGAEAGDAAREPRCSLLDAVRFLPTELIVLMASYALLFRMLTFFEFPAADAATLVWCKAVLRIGGMAALVVYLARRRFTPSTRQVFVPLLFLTVIGLALLPASGAFPASLSVAIVESSWTFFYVILWIALFEIARSRRVDMLLLFLLGWTIMNTILLAAAPVAWVLESQVNQGVLSMTALALVLVYMFSVALLLMRRHGSPALPDDDAPESGGQGTADAASASDWKEGQSSFYRALASSRQLTPRETEVFEWLARGYSLPAIEEQLVLSHSTVKGHARNIYRKFAVAGKQELIAAVEEEQARADGRADGAGLGA